MIKEVKALIAHYVEEQKNEKYEGRRQTSLFSRNLLRAEVDNSSSWPRYTYYDENDMVCKKINNNYDVQKNKRIIYYLHILLDVLYERNIKITKPEKFYEAINTGMFFTKKEIEISKELEAKIKSLAD